MEQEQVLAEIEQRGGKRGKAADGSQCGGKGIRRGNQSAKRIQRRCINRGKYHVGQEHRAKGAPSVDAVEVEQPVERAWGVEKAQVDLHFATGATLERQHASGSKPESAQEDDAQDAEREGNASHGPVSS